MFLMNADLPSTPPQVIERDISSFQFTSSSKKSEKDRLVGKNVATSWYNNVLAHRGWYHILGENVMVITVIQDLNGMLIDGAQYMVALYNPTRIISVSTSYKEKKIDGSKYTVCKHKNFDIYSRENKQFITFH